MFFSRGLIGANSKGESAVEVSASTLLLNGSTQYIDCGDVDEADDITVSMWIRTDVIGSDQVIANRWLESTDNRSWVFYINTSGFLTVAYSSDGTATGIGSLTTTLSISASTQYFVAMRIVSGVISVSVNNGTEQSSGSVSIFVGTALLEIGGRTNLSAPFDGSISNFSMLDTTTDYRAELYNNGTPKQPWLLSQGIQSPSLILLPLNDQTNGNQYSDYSGNANDATATGSPTLTGTSLTIVNSSDKGP